MNTQFRRVSNRPPFDNVAFRKAINYAIDRDAIVELTSLERYGQSMSLPVGNAAFDADLCAEHGYTFDLERAKEMFAEANLTDGDGTVCRDGRRGVGGNALDLHRVPGA